MVRAMPLKRVDPGLWLFVEISTASFKMRPDNLIVRTS